MKSAKVSPVKTTPYDTANGLYHSSDQFVVYVVTNCHQLLLLNCKIIVHFFIKVFKPGTCRPAPARAWFLKTDPVRIVGMRVCVCVCLCVRAQGY